MSNHAANAPNSWEVNAVLDRALSQLRNYREQRTEPIALVGMGCRFPGASSPEQFWDLLEQGRCEIRETPTDRWDGSRLLAKHPGEKGRITANQAGYLDQVDQFDAAFFNLSRREANLLDPQQRLLLEVAWETLENANINPQTLRGSQTGVYIGLCTNDYLHLLTRNPECQIDAWFSTGNAHGSAAGRLSYFFDWRGPCLAIDTACSSSLVALHLAVQAIRNNECQTAFVAGVNLMLTPDLSISLSQAGMLSPEGRCKTFSDSADGFVRGEGCGAVFLKRLSQAQADGDHIYCVLRGSATNQDGRSVGLTAPNGLAQQAVIQAALTDAKLSPKAVSYVEAHGTGTALGDPVEMSALEAVYGRERSEDSPLFVGSVKTNFGHLEGAAGIAGVIKTALALSKQTLPPHLNCDTPSTKIHWDWPVQVTTKQQEWIANKETPRSAGVSSFGFGGTNAHILLEESPPPIGPSPAQTSFRLLKLSARTVPALTELVHLSLEHLNNSPLAETCYTSCIARADFTHRIAIPISNQQAMRQSLENWLSKPHDQPDIYQNKTQEILQTRWIIPDHFECQPGNGKELYETHPRFRELWDGVDAVLTKVWPRSLTDMLWEQPEILSEDHSTIQVALQILYGELWRNWGIEPYQFVAEGLGEISAGYLAGLFSVEDALKLTIDREHAFSIPLASSMCSYSSSRLASGNTNQLLDPSYWYGVESSNTVASSLFSHPVESNEIVPFLVGNDCSQQPQTEARQAIGGIQGGSWFNVEQLLHTLSQLYVAGAEINWQTVFPGPMRKVPFPNYPFQRKRYWLPMEPKPRGNHLDTHPLIQEQALLPDGDFEIICDLNANDDLNGHKLGALCLCPLTVFLEIALAGVVQNNPWDRDVFQVMELQIQQPVFWQSGTPCLLKAVFTPQENSITCQFEFQHHGEWENYATCRIQPMDETHQTPPPPESTPGQLLDVNEHYQRCQQAGLVYEGAFRCVQSLTLTPDNANSQARGTIQIPDVTWTAGYHFHPALLDGCLQLTMTCLRDQSETQWVPSGIQEYRFHQSPSRSTVISHLQRVHQLEPGKLLVNLQIFDETETLLAEILGLTLQKSRDAASALLSSSTATDNSLAKAVLTADGDELGPRMTGYVRSCLAHILDLTTKEVELDQALLELGMDSMMAIELRNDLQTDLGIDLTMEELLDVLTPRDLIERLTLHLENQGALNSNDESNTEWVEGVL